ncbi:6582_t:CDS:10 [Scutellospora calospora]|uniref:6582_t:CDS:1 n=1 Tax=Scutellospora calospora TaxID=85575 RepID=A0ACA9K5V3_9GLOM|nr:6582_t:CDS:10 [Scutellospora calospora]
MRELEKYRKDAQYKKYVQQVERILLSFDKEVNEWADFISFLGKLLKAFQAYPQFPVIPRKLLVTKRLAQSLHPGLPPGVHQKALEVYAYIFKTIGSDLLAEDLPIYSQGLFPFFQYAAMSVKPQLLDLYENYMFPLKERLRPVMKAFIIALLPGLEEEGSEFFDKVLSLLDYLSGIVEKSYFLQSMWLVLITCPALRTPALSYLSRRMPKIASKEDVAFVLGDDVGIMVRAFSSTLGDRQVLVQRAILEILVVNFPLKVNNFGDIMQQDDLILLMKSATSVVLRKDMSLNRRLYAWLLGPDDHIEQQIDHFQVYAKSAVVSALKSSFFMDADDLANAQRPYKILISLMDKWEIGQPIVQELFIDVLWSLKKHVDKSEFGMDLLQTANMFMEMIEPYLIWMKLYGLLDKFSSKDGLDTSALDLVNFILNSFKLHEEEIEQIHLPLFLTALLCKLQNVAQDSNFISYILQVESALQLALDIFQKIPNSVFHKLTKDSTDKPSTTNRPLSQVQNYTFKADSSNEDVSTAPPSQVDLDFFPGMDPIKYINNYYLYGSDNIENKKFSGIRGRFLAEELLKIIREFLNCIITKHILIKNDNNKGETQRSFAIIIDRACKLLRDISTQLYHIVRDTRENETEILKLFTGEWVDSLLKCCYMIGNFEIIDSALSTLLYLVIDKRFISSRLLDSKQQIRDIVDTLWRFLGPNYNVLHLRSSQLIWKLKDVSHANYVEAVISEYLIQKDSSIRLANFERFGIFWMLSAGFHDTDTAFSQQMFLVLDSLRDENPSSRRAGETWMRWNRNNKSYIRILHPIVKILCDSTILRKKTQSQIDDGTFEVIYYEKPFNQAQVDYVFETLSTMCRVGGNAFLNAIHVSSVKTELINSCTWLKGNENSSNSMTYSELFIRISLIYIESEVLDTSSSMNMFNQHIHLHAAEFLHQLVENPNLVNNEMVYLVYETILRKMYYCISSKQLDLQAKLLPLLRSTIINLGKLNEHFVNGSLTSNSPSTKKLITEQYSSSPTGHNERSVSKEEVNDSKHSRTSGLTVLFTKVLTMSLSKHSNRPLLQEWMDLIEISIPYLRQSFNNVLIPLIQCICEQLSNWKTETQYHYTLMIKNSESVSPNSSQIIHDYAMSDWDIITLFNGFEEIVKDCLNKHTTDDGDITSHGSRSYDTTLGLPTITGYVTGVFSADYGTNETPISEQQKPRDYILYTVFPNIVTIILDIWTVFKISSSSNRPKKAGICPIGISLAHTETRVKNRIKNLLEELYRKSHAELVEAFVELWYIENPDITAAITSKGVDSTVIEVLKIIPGSSVPKVINTLLINARGRSLGVQMPKVKKPGYKTNKLQAYCDSLGELEPLTKVWPQCISYVKDHFAQATTYKYLFPNILRFMHGLADKLCSTAYFKDKKVKKDMQDVYQRVLDYCILISGRQFDQGWLRRSTPLPEGEDDNTEEADESETERNRITTPVQEEKKTAYKSKEEILIDQTNQYLATIVIPTIKRLLAESEDKIIAILTNLMYYVIAPSLKNRSNVGISPITLDLLCETSKIDFAYRVWRKEAWDVFIDNRFFHMTPTAAKKWRIIMQTIMTSEKERLVEVLTRITTTPANALFVNKELESLNRALNLRRLSFIIYCGKMDQYLSQIPNIHEKLVELFKLGFGELVHAEIYLCLRILMCRVSNQPISSFWPVILTELLRLCGSYLQKDTTAKDNSKGAAEQPEVANSLLAACKFLDLLFVMQTNSFQPYEWIFISNTINVIKRTLEYSPYALLDKLSDHLSGHEDPSKLSLDNLSNNKFIWGTHSISSGGYKRPMLTLHNITSIRQLELFLRNISLYVYHSTYTLAKPDIQFIESLLENDLLEYSGGFEIGNLEVERHTTLRILKCFVVLIETTD